MFFIFLNIFLIKIRPGYQQEKVMYCLEDSFSNYKFILLSICIVSVFDNSLILWPKIISNVAKADLIEEEIIQIHL